MSIVRWTPIQSAPPKVTPMPEQLDLFSYYEYVTRPKEDNQPNWSPDPVVTNRRFGPHIEGGPPDFSAQSEAIRNEHRQRFALLEARYNAREIDQYEFERGIIELFDWSVPLLDRIDRAYAAYWGIP